MRDERRYLEEVVGADARRQERLVRVAERRVRQQGALLLTDVLGESLWTIAEEDFTKPGGRRNT